MSDNTINVSIKGTDQLSPVFEKVSASAKEAGSALKDVGNSSSGGLDKTAASAKKAGAAVQDMGQDAQKASTAMDKTGQAASKASGGLDKFGKSAESTRRNMTVLGAATGVLVGGLAKVGQGAETQRRQIMALEKAYGTAGQAAADFSRELSGQTRFSLEDTQEAMRIMATLYNNYGVSMEQVQGLMRTTADLATTTGISLADAAMRTSSAIRGEAESAEYLGLTMNQAAIDRENLTLKMSNQEAAQFRLNALNEQAAFSQGAAGESAATTAGQMEQLTNKLSQAATGVGEFIGPIGAMAAPLGEAALLLPIAGAAVGDLAEGMNIGAGASRAFAAALGPVGISLGIIAVAVGIAVKAHMDQVAAVEEMTASYQDALDVIRQLEGGLTRVNLLQSLPAPDLLGYDEEGNRIVQFSEEYDALIEKRGETIQELEAQAKQAQDGRFSIIPEFTEMTEADIDRAAIEWWADYSLSAAEAAKVMDDTVRGHNASGDAALSHARALSELHNQHFKEGTLEGGLYAQTIDDIATALEYAGPNAEQLDAELGRVLLRIANGDMTAQQAAEAFKFYADNAAFLADNLGTVEEAQRANIEAQQDIANQTGVLSTELTEQEKSYTGATAAMQRHTAARHDAVDVAEAELHANEREANARAERQALYALEQRSIGLNNQAHAEEFDAYTESITASGLYGQNLKDAAAAAYEAAGGSEKHAEAMDAAKEAVDAYNQSATALANTLREAGGVNVLEVDESGIQQLSGSVEDLATAYGHAGMGAAELFATLYDAPFLDVASDIETTGAALDKVIEKYSQLDALGSRSAAAGTIASNLIGEPGEWATIDDLVTNGALSVEEYNETVRAGTQIAQLDAAVQQDLNVIRARGMTELANQEAAYATAIDTIANMSNAQTELALSTLDVATQQQFAAAQSALYAAAMGQMPAEVATSVVLDIANADADAAALLETLGVIEQTPDGEWAMAIDVTGGEEAKATLDTLQTNVQDLQATQIDIFLASTGDEEALARLKETREELEALDGATATASTEVTGADRARQQLEEARTAADSLDGKTVVITVSAELEQASDYDAQGLYQGIGDETQKIPIEFEVNDDAVQEWTPPTFEAITVPIEIDDSALAGVNSMGGPGERGEAAITIPAKVELDTSELDALTGANSTGGSAGAIPIAAELSVNTDELSRITEIDPPTITVNIDPQVDDAKLASLGSIDLPHIPVIIEPQVDDAAFGALGSIDIPAIQVPVEITYTSGEATGIATPDIPDIVVDVSFQVDDASFSSAKSAADQWDGTTYTATLEATNNAQDTINTTRNSAASYASATYLASLTATDGASGTISTASGAATAFATTYTATLAVADQATPTIGTAQGMATAFATTYSATITAVDQASGVISSVSGQLDALNGKTATTYVNTVQTGSVAPAMMHGGTVRPDIPVTMPIAHAAHGRGVMVGEAGPEMAMLPYGTLVQPSGASASRQESSAGAGTEMVDTLTAELLSGQDKAREAGAALADAAAEGVNSGASEFQSGISKEYTGFKVRPIKNPKFPKALPEDASDKQVKVHERQTDKAEGKLDSAIDKATDQWQEAPDPASRKKAMEILARLLGLQYKLQAAEEAREAAADRAARKEEAAAKQAESNMGRAAESASEAGTALEGVGDSAGVASGAIEKLNATMDQLGGNNIQSITNDVNRARSSLQNLGKVTTTPDVQLNTNSFDKSLEDVTSDGEELADTTFIPDASMNRDMFDRIWNDVTSDLESTNKEIVKPTVDADRTKFDTVMRGITNGAYSVGVEVVYKDDVKDTHSPPASLHGGAVRAARHGRSITAMDMIPHAQHGYNILVGEAGPEIVNLPLGSMVHTNPASRSRAEGMNDGGSFHFHGPVYFQVKDNDALGAVRRHVRNESR